MVSSSKKKDTSVLCEIRDGISLLQARLEDFIEAILNRPLDLTSTKESSIIDEDSPVFIPSADKELQADIKVEEKETDRSELDDTMAKFRAARRTKAHGEANE